MALLLKWFARLGYVSEYTLYGSRCRSCGPLACPRPPDRHAVLITWVHGSGVRPDSDDQWAGSGALLFDDSAPLPAGSHGAEFLELLLRPEAPQLLNGPKLDLSNALTGHMELLTDFFQSARGLALKAKA